MGDRDSPRVGASCASGVAVRFTKFTRSLAVPHVSGISSATPPSIALRWTRKNSGKPVSSAPQRVPLEHGLQRALSLPQLPLRRLRRMESRLNSIFARMACLGLGFAVLGVLPG